jgi:hypothetical protein
MTDQLTSSSYAYKFMIRKWWGRMASSWLHIIFGLLMIFLLTEVEFTGFSVLLGIFLTAGGICLLTFGYKRKTWGRLRTLLIVEGALNIFIGMSLWLAITNTTNAIKILELIIWGLLGATLSLLGWRFISKEDGMFGPQAGKMMALSSACYAVFAATLMFIPTDDLTSSIESLHRNGMIIFLLLVAIGAVSSLAAIERVNVAEYPKLFDRRWILGIVLLLSGTFLVMLGIFAYNFRDLVAIDGTDLGIANLFGWGHPYEGMAALLLGAGAILTILGGVLLVTSRKRHHARLSKRTATICIVALLLVQGLAAMLLVNPATFNNGGGRWDLQVGDFYEYGGSSVSYIQHRDYQSGELINYTTSYWNYTGHFTVIDVAGRNDFYLSADLNFEGSDPLTIPIKMPKAESVISPNTPLTEVSFVRNESVWTPWGPRACERYSGHGYAGGGSIYSCDQWRKDGIVLLMTTSIQSSNSYSEPREWTIRNEVSMLVDTSLEQVTQGPSDAGGPPQADWTPTIGDRFNYSCLGGIVGQGQPTEWRYLVKNVTGYSMQLNLSIFSQDDLVTPLASGDVERSSNATSMGVLFFPGRSEGDFTFTLIGNETLSTPWGLLACNHYQVARAIENASSYTSEDIYVRNGVLIRMEDLRTGFSLELEWTNL